MDETNPSSGTLVVSFQSSGVLLRCVPRGPKVEGRGSFLNEVGERWHLEGAGDAVMDVVIETDPQFGGGHR